MAASETFHVCDAVLSDVKGIAQVNFTAWRETYCGLIEDDFLNSISVERYKERWHLILSRGDSHSFVIVIKNSEEEIIGYCSGGKAREPFQHFEGEIYALYLLKNFHGKGIGKRLFTEALKKLKGMGFKSFFLFVLHNNPTLSFYRHYQPNVEAPAIVKIGEHTYEDIGMGWNDFSRFSL